MSSDTALLVVFVVVELLAVVLNIVTLYLVAKQGFRHLDMLFATVMTVCDLFVVAYKLCELAYITLGKNPRLLLNLQYGQYQGIGQIFILQMSATCIGVLALLRFWVIVLRRSINKKAWIACFVASQLFFALFLLIIAGRSGLALVSNHRFYYPDINSKDGFVVFTRYMIVGYVLFNILTINICYPCIAWRYLRDLHLMSQERGIRSHVEAESLRNQKRLVLLKIGLIITCYDIVMLTYFFYIARQLITSLPNTATTDNLVGVLLIILTLTNPLMLITLHYETWQEFKAFFLKFRINSYSTKSKDGFQIHQSHDIPLQPFHPLPSPLK